MFQVVLIILLILPIAAIIAFRKVLLIQYYIFGNFRLYKIGNIKNVYEKSIVFFICDVKL